MEHNNGEKNPGENCQDIIRRLRTIKGHIAGIEKMIEDGKSCDAVLAQIVAAKSSIHKVGLLVMQYEVQDCLRIAASDGKNGAGRIEEILKTVLNYSK